jgi:hypothetical protein
LKINSFDNTLNPPLVAPRVGAWIENPKVPEKGVAEFVAPRVGAWIEKDDYEHGNRGRIGRSSRRSVD